MSNPALEVRDCAVGRGLFAVVPIEAHMRVIEYTGKKIPTAFADTLTSQYLFDLENGYTLDGEEEVHLARYVNHACFPNCEARIEDGRIFFYALRDIVPDEEITIDYGEEYVGEFIRPRGCECHTCNKKAAQ